MTVSNERSQGPKKSTLESKVALVIGGGRGIGRATALRLASEGASVIVAARTASELDNVVAEIQAKGGYAVGRSIDTTNANDLRSLADEIAEEFGRIDVLVNSAGASLIAPLESTTESSWDRIIETNLKGPYLSTRTMLGLLRASEGGQVVNIASKVGVTGYRLVSAYTASKAGLIGFSRALAQELRDEGIRILVICPGPVDTAMRWEATPNLDPDLTISADTVAETILFLVTLDRRAVMNEVILEAIAYDEQAVPIGD
jgi:NAD(P)-dependent dehydrogenase (short-subunit alcohol dehydrogenase family)